MADSRLVILLGPPACGKGTQAKELNTRFGWRTFSTGAAIRSHVQRGTPFGARFKELLGSAYLLPDDVIIDLVADELRGHQGGLVLDGFPRTMPQADLFDGYCRSRGWNIDAVIAITATHEELAPRVLSRLTCQDCGGTFRGGTPDGHDMESDCPDCPGKLTRRKDDTPEVFAERFAEYDALTKPLIARYTERGILHSFSALTPSGELATQIESLIARLP